jgi:hypothetical protein
VSKRKIAKKKSAVKSRIEKKPSVITRNKIVSKYITKKDSLGHKYSIVKATGKRVSNHTVEIERKWIRNQKNKLKRIQTGKVQKRGKTSTQIKREEKELAKIKRQIKKAKKELAKVRKKVTVRSTTGKRKFVPITELNIPIQEQLRIIRTPKFEEARIKALDKLGIQRSIIEERIRGGNYDISEEEYIRLRMEAAARGVDDKYINEEVAAAELADEFDKNPNEIFHLMMSPSWVV